MALPASDVSGLLSAAFNEADRRYPDIHRAWVTVSFKIGGRLGNSLLGPAVQRDGSLDRILRSMEDEHRLHVKDFAIHYQKMLSDLWVGSLYETFRLLQDRCIAPTDDEFRRLAHELRLLRIPIEKHEIAIDRKLPDPLILTRVPPSNDERDHYSYSAKDPARAHIMPTSVSSRGSLMWQVIDAADGLKAFWIERRDLSDRIIAFWLKTKGMGELEAEATNKKASPKITGGAEAQ